jgi:cysteine desulfurase
VDFRALGVATLAASAHKFHGPVGVGVLLVRRDTKLAPLMFGGGQQQGRRPGTPPVALAVGLARALELWEEDHEARTTRWRSLVGRLEDGIIKALGAERAVRIGPSEERFRLPQTLQIGFPNVDGDVLLMRLDQAGVLCSTGSACASGASRPSSSLVALGVPPDILRSSIRFSLGAKTTDEEINESCVIIRKVLSEFQVK